MNTPSSEEPFVDFKCPFCAQPVSFPEDRVGIPEECPNCFEILIVPAPGVEIGVKFPVPITTPRMVLRRFRPGDWKDLLAVMSDEDTFRYTDWYPLDEEAVIGWIEKDRPVRLTGSGGNLCLGLELREQQKLIGWASFYYLTEDRQQAAFGVVLGIPHRRQGFGTEAVRALMDFGFKGIGLHRLAVGCDPRNVAGCRMLEHAKMRKEGECSQDRARRGEWVDTALYAMLESEHEPSARA